LSHQDGAGICYAAKLFLSESEMQRPEGHQEEGALGTMICTICHLPVAGPPAIPWTDTREGRMHQYEGSHEGGPYDPARLLAAVSHLPLVHEICALMKPALARGKLIRLDERLRS